MKKSNLFLSLGLLFIAAALSLIVYNIWQNNRAGEASQTALTLLEPHIGDAPNYAAGESGADPAAGKPSGDDIEYPDYVLDPEMSMPTENVNGVDYIGVIRIPAIDLELPVINNWNYANLEIAPCRYAGSVYLDNMVLCAHNFTIHFGPLRYLNYGDEVTFTDMDGNVFSYRVLEIETLQPTSIEEMKTGDWDLTLFTCTLGGATRVTVRCEKVI